MATPAEELVRTAAENAPQLRLIIGGAGTVAATGATVGAATAFSPIIIGVIILALIILLVAVLLRIPVVRGWAQDAGDYLKASFSHMINPVVRIGDSLNHTLEQALFATPWAIGELGDYLAWVANLKLPRMINSLRSEEDSKILSVIGLLQHIGLQLWDGIASAEQRVNTRITAVADSLVTNILTVFQWAVDQFNSLRQVEIPNIVRPIIERVQGLETVTIPNVIRWAQTIFGQHQAQISNVQQTVSQVAQRADTIERCIPKCDSPIAEALREASDDALDLLSEFGGLVFAAIAIPGVPKAVSAIRRQSQHLAVAAAKLLGE